MIFDKEFDRKMLKEEIKYEIFETIAIGITIILFIGLIYFIGYQVGSLKCI
jgi:uncharacterized membrane protein YukC